MYYHGDYNQFFEDSLIEELEWLKEEFQFLFKERHHFTEKDKNLAKQIIENIVKNSSDNDRTNEFLIETLEALALSFPDLF